MNKSIIRVFIPFRAKKSIMLRTALLKEDAWTVADKLDSSFYLRYIDKIFDSSIYSDCFVLQSTLSLEIELDENIKLDANYARVFSFDTDVSFMELQFPYDFNTLDDVANISSMLRITNRPLKCNGEKTTLNGIAEKLIAPFDKISFFDHLGDNGLTRSELFASVILGSAEENLDASVYKIASGLNSAYTGETDGGEFYSNFPHIRWAVSDRGICNVAMLKGNAKDDDFIKTEWFRNTNQRYIVWYILILHQKYFLYQCMNDIAKKSSSDTLKHFRESIMSFNTKYRFSKISEESSHQTLYEITSRVKELDDLFKDIDEKVNRIEQHRELKSDKNTSHAMTIISILCALSAFKDLYELISQNHSEASFSSFISNLSTSEAAVCVLFILASLIALFIMLPKEPVVGIFRKIYQKITQKNFENKFKK